MNYRSQYQQDKFLNENFFHNKKNGTFLDIGAYDGVTGSNSYFFEKELGWNGICIEPLPKIFEKLKSNRSCILSNAAAWKENTTKTFKIIDGYSEMLSGIVDCYDIQHINRINVELSTQPQTSSDVSINCIDINEFLKEKQIFHFDFLSIDVEGSEFVILKHLDFNLFDITYIICENNYDDMKIHKLMSDNGYKFLQKLSIDDVYIKNQ